MAEYKRWVVDAVLKGSLYIRDKVKDLPSLNARALLTPYALLEQNLEQSLTETRIYLGFEIRIDADHLCVAYQEMEAFIRALAIEHNICISVVSYPRMTDNPAEWPEGIGFLKARDFPICSEGWQPVNHYKDPKNRLRGSYAANLEYTGQSPILASRLERAHTAFLGHTQYQSELVKDYLAGLDTEWSHPSVAMLYFSKVLERIGKMEYGAAKKRFLTNPDVKSLMAGLPLTDEEKREASAQILKWRHNKSEAHLVTEGAPARHELLMCKKIARLVLERALSSQ